MAVATLLDSQLSLVFDMGVDENGKAVTKRKNYNNVKTSATPDQLLQAAQAIVSLQTETLASVERNDTNQIDA
ncbi:MULTISPECIES: DUF1659 domain-containing protein [Metabacillus]|jgi:Neuraminidase (sialidase)|uniref:DUF1659 domain-containing protein n=3 Tax=Metabacillus TaxID=2675233 RepID=A0A179T3V0_9BACI|nr:MULTISPECIES: DUF1659 domain-containing protein [Metabacillus]MBO1511835.1 DUF1659 domain-containing protein [Metabacillus bambusae]OAS87789.1 hypothetical protein A6K24_18805 [Metabacillus litoralis]QNF27289.1 DUF1659 domain-containing protein [Metabacillus sp. KUDC1714]